jgi:hypothetical protein
MPKVSRLSLTAAAAAAAGALGTAGVIAGATHSAGQAGTSAFDSVSGLKAQATAATAEPWLPHSRADTRVQLDSGQASVADGSAATAVQPAGVQARPAKAAAMRPRSLRTHVAPARPYLIYDSVRPRSIPAGQHVIAAYANGAYAVSARAVARRGPVLWIDTNGSEPAASALDVEPGDATPAGAARWARQRLKAYPRSLAIIYTFRNDWQQVKDSVADLPAWMRSRVRYWIADPTGVQHVVAGSSATQWYWGNRYDITTATPDFQIP